MAQKKEKEKEKEKEIASMKKELHPPNVISKDGYTLCFTCYNTLHFRSKKKNIFYKCATYESDNGDIVDYVIYPKALRGKILESWNDEAVEITGDNIADWDIYIWHKKKRKKSVKK